MRDELYDFDALFNHTSDQGGTLFAFPVELDETKWLKKTTQS